MLSVLIRIASSPSYRGSTVVCANNKGSGEHVSGKPNFKQRKVWPCYEARHAQCNIDSTECPKRFFPATRLIYPA